MEEDSSVTELGVCLDDMGVGISDGLPDDVDKVCLNLYMNHPALAPTRTVRRKITGYKIERYEDGDD